MKSPLSFVMDYPVNGSATPMGGKSMTCRKHSQNPAVDDHGSQTREEKGFSDGKSQTCRASAWQSHVRYSLKTTAGLLL